MLSLVVFKLSLYVFDAPESPFGFIVVLSKIMLLSMNEDFCLLVKCNFCSIKEMQAMLHVKTI